jgi:DNA polymerase-3 subunit beta
MKLITTKQALVECLGIANKAVSSRSSIQVLSGVLIEARDEAIVLSATDMEISIRAPLAGRVEQVGSLVVPARLATDIARSLPTGDVVMEQRPGETQVEIRAGESLFNLHSLPAVDFPQLPAFSGEGFSVSKSAFIETVDRVAPAASRDETRPVLTGVLIHFAKNCVRMVATDSYRLSVKETPVQSSVSGTLQAIVPARTLLELSRIATAVADETITILPTENQMLFQVGGISLVSRLIDGQFPNYKQLITTSFSRPSVVSGFWRRKTLPSVCISPATISQCPRNPRMWARRTKPCPSSIQATTWRSASTRSSSKPASPP